jgi:hypothetical protein
MVDYGLARGEQARGRLGLRHLGIIPRRQMRASVQFDKRLLSVTMRSVIPPRATFLLLALAGCGSTPMDYLDEMEFLPVREKLVETQLDTFAIPVPAADRDSRERVAQRNRLQVVFKIYALVRPRDEDAILMEWKRQRGKFRDDVMKTCREATLDELTEPALATLKGRLAELASRRLGRDRIRRLVLDEITVRPL